MASYLRNTMGHTLTMAAMLASACSPSDIQKAEKPITEADIASTYPLGKDYGFSKSWMCRAKQIYQGKPLTNDQIVHINLGGYTPGPLAKGSIKPADLKRGYYLLGGRPVNPPSARFTITHNRAQLSSAEEDGSGGTYLVMQGRLYPTDVKQTVSLLRKEFGDPTSIIQTLGEGCRLGSTTMIYSPDGKDADGRVANTSAMCSMRSQCRFEKIDPCIDPDRLSRSRTLIISLDERFPETEILVSGKRMPPRVKASISLSDPLGPIGREHAVRMDAPACKPIYDPFSH